MDRETKKKRNLKQAKILEVKVKVLEQAKNKILKIKINQKVLLQKRKIKKVLKKKIAITL